MAKEKLDGEIIRERKRWAFLGLPFTFTQYILTEKKLVIRKGAFKTVEEEILLYRVIDMTLIRTLGNKMFKTGTIILYSNDKTTPELEIKNIKNARNFKELLSDAVEEDRQRRGVRQSEFIGVNHDDTDI